MNVNNIHKFFTHAYSQHPGHLGYFCFFFFFFKFGVESPPKVAVNQIRVKVQAPSDKVDSGFPSASPHNSTSPLAPTRRQVVGCLQHVISTGESRKGGNPKGYLNFFFSFQT